MSKVAVDREGKKIWCGSTDVLHPDCIHRSCFQPHDCGYLHPVYVMGRWVRSRKVHHSVCVTRHKDGCPREFRILMCCAEPSFSLKGHPMSRRCRACGRRVPVRVVRLWRKQLSTGRATTME